MKLMYVFPEIVLVATGQLANSLVVVVVLSRQLCGHKTRHCVILKCFIKMQLNIVVKPSIMVALWNRADYFPSPDLSGRRLDVYDTSTHCVALVRI